MYFSERRNATTAQSFFEGAIDGSGVRPTRITTDKAKCYPPTLGSALSSIEHRCSKYLNNGLERDQGHLKQRLNPVRGFKSLTSADTISDGQALIQNLRAGFSMLTHAVPRQLRPAPAWPQLSQMI